MQESVAIGITEFIASQMPEFKKVMSDYDFRK